MKIYNQFRVWSQAARPQTLPAAIVPVVVGVGLAQSTGSIDWSASLAALACALLIQIGTNFANDYYDYIKGADNKDRVGFQRATASGLISARQMYRATILVMSLAFLLGLYLVWIGGWPILGIGIASIACGLAYTGGPFPLGYNALGDIFVFLFFGIVAVMGTYYVNTFEWTRLSFMCSLPIGALTTNILVVNNLRDIEEDQKAGKKTLGVLFGANALKIEYILMHSLAFAVPFVIYYTFFNSLYIFLPLLSLPWGITLTYKIFSKGPKQKLNRLLEETGQHMALYGLLFTAALLLA